MIVIGLDPGTEKSAIVGFDGDSVLKNVTAPNEQILEGLSDEFGPLRMVADGVRSVLVIEEFESYGMAVGKEVFRTIRWAGNFEQAYGRHRTQFLPRRIVKQHLCHSARATDSNIRQALIDRFGPGADKAIGKKASPGPLYGVKGHEIAALAVAVTWFDLHKDDGELIRPGVNAEF